MGTASHFDEVVADIDYPVYVVTAAHGDQRAGCLVGFTTQCSINPPRFLVCLSKANRTWRVARRADALGVHLLRHDQRDLARLFGESTGDEVDKFGRCRWEAGPSEVPVLADCDSWFVGTIVGRLDLGDHDGFHLEPVHTASLGRMTPLTFQAVADLVPGHRAEDAAGTP